MSSRGPRLQFMEGSGLFHFATFTSAQHRKNAYTRVSERNAKSDATTSEEPFPPFLLPKLIHRERERRSRRVINEISGKAGVRWCVC